METTDELRMAVLRLGRRLRLERAPGDVSDSQLSALFVLWKEGPMTLTALAERERVTPPSMNRTVNGLVEAGLVARSGSADDGRKVLIEATGAGAALAQEIKRRRAAWFSRQVATLDDAERAALEVAAPILRRLADS
ncbi:MAG: MarR family transcriptional regulator [Rhodoglobus sp.]